MKINILKYEQNSLIVKGIKMNIQLIDHDSSLPNLALMKISSYHKSNGDKTFLNACENPDKIYISCIFKKNRSQLLGIKHFFDCEIIIGGVGFNNEKLPDKIENMKPDYSLYNIDYSMGYTSKGCIRNCSFCIVPKYEGKIKNHHSIDLIMDQNHNKLMLFDNNYLASPKWRENLEIIIDSGIKLNFNQGLDIRLINDENAELLSNAKIFNKKFKANQIHFAFDSLKYKTSIIEGINKLSEYGIKPYRLMFYILVNYDTSLYEDFYRTGLLIKYKTDPFIMKYSNSDPLLNQFARFINKRIYKVNKFENYDRLTLIQKMKVIELIEKLPEDIKF